MSLTPSERAYIRALYARKLTPEWYYALATEWSVPPRDRTDRETWIGVTEVRKFIINLSKEWSRHA